MNLKNMKCIILGSAVLAAGVAAGIILNPRNRKGPLFDTDAIDGGVVTRNDGEGSPKVISSTEITSFDCEFSLIAHADKTRLKHGVYTLHAALNGDAGVGSIRWRNRYDPSGKLEFEADAAFMAELQRIVSKYDLARLNGCTHRVSGLPDMYGMKLDICYASGESIYTYDNQSNRLPIEVMCELEALFMKQSKK